MAVSVAFGLAIRRRVAATITASVPSEPIRTWVRL